MSRKRDSFYDDDDDDDTDYNNATGISSEADQNKDYEAKSSVPISRKTSFSTEFTPTESPERPTVEQNRQPTPPISPTISTAASKSALHSRTASPQPLPIEDPIAIPTEIIGEAHHSRSPSISSVKKELSELKDDHDQAEHVHDKTEKYKDVPETSQIDRNEDQSHRSSHVSLPVENATNIQYYSTIVQNGSIVVETKTVRLQLETPMEKTDKVRITIPLVEDLLNQPISSAVPIISFCQPFSMTSHIDDIILAMPRHLMIISNQSSVSVYPWRQSIDSTSTILECYWCSYLYKLLVTTLEDNHLYIYDFISIVDSIQLRGDPLSIKHESYHSQQRHSTLLLPTTSQYKASPAIWSQTRFTKSNSLGIYYCYISRRQNSCMLARIDHNTRKHIKAIDCSGGGGINKTARVSAMGLSEEQIAIALTNLTMTIYDAESLIGLHQINLTQWRGCNIRGVSSIMYLWRTWLVLDPIDNKIVGLGKRKRQFSKFLPEQPINCCSMDNGTLALWIGYPGALFYYRLME